MDLIPVLLFVVLFYIRPWEWNGLMASFGPVNKVMAAGLALMILKKIELNKLSFKGMIRTPVDWAMLAFIAWIVYAAPDSGAAWDNVSNRLGYFLVVAHALSNWKRIEVFLWTWMAMIFIISILGVLGYYGIYDPFGTYVKTHAGWKGRLALNLAVFNNPNAFGHSLVPVIPMIYYLGIFRRFIVIREITAPMFVMPLWALYLTQSKGSFLAAAATSVATAAFGRPKMVQASIIAFAYGSGMSILLLLPRMGVIKNPKSDAGIRGRIRAQQFGWDRMQAQPHGLGYGNFMAVHSREANEELQKHIKVETYKFENEQLRRRRMIKLWENEINRLRADKKMRPDNRDQAIMRRRVLINSMREEMTKEKYVFGQKNWITDENKAVTSHNSYVEVGAELGKNGLLIWLAVLYYCLKTVMRARCHDDQQERIRRLMFCVLSSYMCSSWATNISYRATFFLQAGVCSAFYYLLSVKPREEALERAQEIHKAASEAARAAGTPPPKSIPQLMAENPPVVDSEHGPVEIPVVEEKSKLEIARGLAIDAVLIYVIYSVVLRGWSYIINDM
jgi:hypothetical protein